MSHQMFMIATNCNMSTNQRTCLAVQAVCVWQHQVCTCVFMTSTTAHVRQSSLLQAQQHGNTWREQC